VVLVQSKKLKEKKRKIENDILVNVSFKKSSSIQQNKHKIQKITNVSKIKYAYYDASQTNSLRKKATACPKLDSNQN